MSGVGKILIGVVAVAAAFIPGVGPVASSFLLSFGLSTALGGVTELLTPKPKFRAPPVTGNTTGGLQTIPLAFGELRLGGLELIPATTTDDFDADRNPGADGVAESYWKAVAHTLAFENGIDSFGDVYLDGQLVSVADIDVNGWVQAAEWLDNDGNSMVQIRSYRGTHAQTADADLVAKIAGWDANHRLRGIAYTIARFVRPQGQDNEAKFQQAFKGRVPEVSRVMAANKCYDPRFDSTRGGSGTQRADDPTTWQWSDNAALVGCTYLLARKQDFGVEIDPDTINWSTVAAAANECDGTFSVPGPATRDNYRFSGILESENPDENLAHIADAMAGVITYDTIEGEWVMYAGVYDAPMRTIDETWLRGDVEYQTKAELGDLYNACKVGYVQPDLDYQATPSLLRTNATYEAEDGGQQLIRELSIPGIDDEFRAQRRALIEINRSREQKILHLPCNLRGLLVKFWDTVTVDLPDVTGVFRIIEYKWSDEGFPDLTLVESLSTTYVTLSGDYEDRTFQPAPNRPTEIPPKPKNLTLTATPEGIHVKVDPLGKQAYDHFEFQRATVNDFSVVEATIETPDSQFTDRVTTKATRYYRAKAVGQSGNPGAWSTTVSVTPDPASLGADPTYQNITLLRNGGFEKDTIGGDSDPNYYFDGSGGGWASGTARSGDRGGVFTCGTYSSDAFVCFNGSPTDKSKHPDIHEGEAVYFEAWCETAGTGTIPVAQVGIYWRQADGTVISSTIVNFATLTSSFQKASVSSVAPAGTSYPTFHGFTKTGGGAARKTIWDDGFACKIANSQKQIPAIVGANVSTGYWSNPPTISSTYQAGPGTATISVGSGTFRLGSNAINYGSSSITGLTPNTNYFLYYKDLAFEGGSRTLYATTSENVMYQDDSNVYIGHYKTAYSGGGGGGGSPPLCIDADAWVLLAGGAWRRARDLEAGDQVRAWDKGVELAPKSVLHKPRLHDSMKFRLRADGRSLSCSGTTPFDTPVDTFIACHAKGRKLLTDRGWRTCAVAEHAGYGPVVRISIGGFSFAASDDPDSGWIVSHNGNKP